MFILNPATEEVIREVNEDDFESLSEKFQLLRSAHESWQQVTLIKRIEILQQFSTLLAENQEQLAGILTSEVGKPLQQSRNEIRGARSRIEWITGHAADYLSEEVMTKMNGLEEKIVYEPLGVIANISAWNYPYLVGVNVFVPALIAGNCVMYKPSEYATLTGFEIEKLLKQVGVPENVFLTAIGAARVGQHLLELPFNGYFFTGSYKTGKYIYEKVASKMVPCQCELGGKDPCYITDDIEDISAVASSTADGAFYNNGQSCCAVERLYVHEHIYDRYIEEFIKEVKSWQVGLPTEPGVYLGPLARRDQPGLLREHVQDALQKGAVLTTGGHEINRKGNYFEPTVLENVNHGMKIMKEESFGPVIGIMKVKDDSEAIALMQDSAYGLTASVYSSDRSRAEGILKKVNAGTGYWNCCDRVSAALPWTGRNHSGIGVTLSHAGMRAFVQPKAYHFSEPAR